MTLLLPAPFLPRTLGCGTSNGFGIDDYSSVLSRCHFINEEIVISARNMIDGGESFVSKKQSFLVRKISSNSHIRHSCECVGEILHCSVKSLEPDEFV